MKDAINNSWWICITPLRDRFGTVLRHFIRSTHRRFLCASRGWVGAFSCAQTNLQTQQLTTRIVAPILPQPSSDHGWRSCSLRNFKRVENKRRSAGKIWISAENRPDQNIQSARFWCKHANAMLLSHRAGTCIFSQSRTEARAVPALLRRGGRGTPRSVIHALRRPPGQEHRCTETNVSALIAIYEATKRRRKKSGLQRNRSEQKMADLGRCRESFQALWNASYVLANGFPPIFGIVREGLGWIPKDSKSADFEQKAWAIAHGFEHGGFE